MRNPLSPSAIGNAATVLALGGLALWLLVLQPAPWPSITPLLGPRISAGIALLLYLIFCWVVLRHRAAGQAVSSPAQSAASQWDIAYASQTGFALELAQRTAAALADTDADAEVRNLDSIDIADLQHGNWLFIVSTTGEGDAPDHALAFASHVLATQTDLTRMRYGLLALGDSTYANFCAFGRDLDNWLQAQGAQRLFQRVEVDNADPAALRQWQQQLATLTGHAVQSDGQHRSYQPWTVSERLLLNAGSPGGLAYHLALQPPTPADLDWQAGDIAEIVPRHPPAEVERWLQQSGLDGQAMVVLREANMPLRDALSRSCLPALDAIAGLDEHAVPALLRPLPHRDYSIASLPAGGQLQLLVRLMQHEDGSPGLGSGWLCQYAAVGGEIDLRIRRNPNFHAPPPSAPMILIGNGTGIAGLRAHLKARIAAGADRNWLLFGERTRAHDNFYAPELDGWLQHGHLAHLDRVFSRDEAAQRYVQDAVRAQTDRLRQWLDAGAAIYVCGSLQGMAPAVDAVLTDAIGQPALDALRRDARYRRDVY
ncbi:MAG: sulfite reductase subunit alpha [Pseudoxanthomonas suwonensis]|nr:MAG: sulfite reductase subunit alpha [Pseudoxanthomonas suwonensis]